MGFTEITFVFIFMPISIAIYLAVNAIFHNDKANNTILVLLSLIFYFWADKESLIVFTIIVGFTYLSGYAVSQKRDDPQKQKIYFSIVCLVGVLVFTKYAALVVNFVNGLANQKIINLGHLIVPIGLSFVVFESISYIVDIYRGDAEPGSLLDCMTFLSLFPKLVSGPIVLWKDFKPQLRGRKCSPDKIAAGIDRIIIGYAKKVIIADSFGARIALINDGIAAGGVDVPTMWLRAILYSFQLYLDFSGYSDIAIGLCEIFGFEIKENFKYPYLSKSVAEFWRRWHISLGTWFREYVYIPLGGNKRGNVYFHLAIVFVLTGLWHGTGWQYLVWGCVHGLFVIIERAVQNRTWYKNTPAFFKWFLTLLIVCFGWVLFMSKDITAAGKSYAGMFIPMTEKAVNFTWRYYLNNRTVLLLIIVLVCHVFRIEQLKNRIILLDGITFWRVAKRIILVLLMIFNIICIVNSSYSPFIYFQF